MYNQTGRVEGANIKIDFGSSKLTERVSGIINQNPTVKEYFDKAGSGGDWDIKSKESNGSLLYGKYASPRDAGNFAAGAIAEKAGFLEPLIQFGYGVYNISKNNKMTTGLITLGVLTITKFNPILGLGTAYFIGKYGEDKLSQLSINLGKQFIKNKSN